MSSLLHQPKPAIIVVGSLNIDLIWQLSALPKAGETVIANSRREDFGGKGANQAVAAARQGAAVTFIGAVGNDASGKRYLGHLRQEGIDTQSILSTTQTATGCAHVYLDAHGENMIVVEPGANMELSKETVSAALHQDSTQAAALLTQLESPADAVKSALKLAKELGIRSILNASPVDDNFQWADVPIDTVIVNEHECSRWFGVSPESLWEQPSEARRALLDRLGITNLVVTRGKDPTFHFDAQGRLAVPGIQIVPLDTVGAGDTFAGALSVQIANGTDWRQAILHANVAAALATQAMGAQSAMPSLAQTLDALQASIHQPAG